jgi:hypothetical protein
MKHKIVIFLSSMFLACGQSESEKVKIENEIWHAKYQADSIVEAIFKMESRDTALILSYYDQCRTWADIPLEVEHLTDAPDFAFKANQFNDIARIVNKFEDSNDDIISSDIVKLKKSAIKAQSVMFPQLRKAYVQFCRKKFWEEDISVKSKQMDYSTIVFEGYQFSSNKIIKAVND